MSANQQLQVVKNQPQQLSLLKGNIDFSELQSLGDVFYKSGYFQDTQSAAQAMVKILAGREYGFDPFASMSNIHIIKGKPCLSANAQSALIKQSNKYDYHVKTQNTKLCEIEFFQKVGEEYKSVGISSFSIEEAKTAQLTSNANWTRFPADMLFARAITRGMRRFCPDLLKGEVVESDFLPPTTEATENTIPEYSGGEVSNEDFEANVETAQENFIEAEAVDFDRLDSEKLVETLLENLTNGDADKRKKLLKGRDPKVMPDEKLTALIDELSAM